MKKKFDLSSGAKLEWRFNIRQIQHLSVPSDASYVLERVDLVPWTHGCGQIVQVPDEDLRLSSARHEEVRLEGVNV